MLAPTYEIVNIIHLRASRLCRVGYCYSLGNISIFCSDLTTRIKNQKNPEKEPVLKLKQFRSVEKL